MGMRSPSLAAAGEGWGGGRWQKSGGYVNMRGTGIFIDAQRCHHADTLEIQTHGPGLIRREHIFVLRWSKLHLNNGYTGA